MNKKNNAAYNKLIELAGNKAPCSRRHFDNCVLWINQRFGYMARLDRLCANLIAIPNYGFNEIFKKTKRLMEADKIVDEVINEILAEG